jgi:DNA-directed RNA polymerase specialized sigma subunit
MNVTVSISLEVSPVWFEGRDLIDYGISMLSDKESDIFNRYFVDRCTLREIGIVYGVVPSRVHQMVKQIRLKVMKRIGRETD